MVTAAEAMQLRRVSQVSPVYAQRVCDEFFEFVSKYNDDFSGDDAPYALLEDYITLWLFHGNAIEVTGGKYENYLLAVLIIINGYTKEPSRLLTGSYKLMRRATPKQPTTLAAGLWRAALLCLGLSIVGPTLWHTLGSAPGGLVALVAIGLAIRVARRLRRRP